MKQIEVNNIFQEYNCELWIKLIFSTKEKPITRIAIDSKIIQKDVDPNAINYVCADLFLGFDQMESDYNYLRGKSKYSSGKH